MALACSFFAVNAVSAQNEEVYYGSEKGGFALTIGADPVINFVGNMFNGTTDNSLSDFGGSIAGKYFLSDKFALKAELGINNFKTKDFTYNPEDEDYKEIIEEETEGSKEFTLGLGVQYNLRPGKRLQPFIGANIYYGRTNEDFNFNEFFEGKYGGDYNIEDYNIYDGYGYLKRSNPVNKFALMANIGVEYFLRQNISISATLDLGIATETYKTKSKFDTDDPDYDNEYIEERNYSYKTRKSTYFATGLMDSKIAFNFYF